MASSSLGSVRLLQVDEDTCAEFKEHMAWEFIHSFKWVKNLNKLVLFFISKILLNKYHVFVIIYPYRTDYASCTALSTFEQDIASVGEDGKLNLLTAIEKKPVRIIGKCCNIEEICVLKVYIYNV